MVLRRGFKAEAERRAAALWAQVDAPITHPIDLNHVAVVVGARIVMADSLVPLARLQQLEEVQPFAFSACTFEIESEPVVVLNPIRLAKSS